MTLTAIPMVLLLAGCTLNVDLAPGKADSGVAVVKGSSRERIFYWQKADIVAVDGKRFAHSIFTSTVNSIRLEPGSHWVEFNIETGNFVGGFNIRACAFEFDFRPYYGYQIRVESVSYEVPWFEMVVLQRYKGSMLIEASSPDGHAVSLTVATTCTVGGITTSFCRTDADCEPSSNQYCSASSGAEFGLCKTHDR
jgi:hypothetical protein